MFSSEFCESFKNIFSYRTSPVAASKCDWFYQSSFWSLRVPRMYINLNMNDNNRKLGLGKKEMLEVKKNFKNFELNFPAEILDQIFPQAEELCS